MMVEGRKASLSNGNGVQHVEEDPAMPTVSSSWINRILFTGTGTSGQVPAAGCLLRDPTSSSPKCITCFDAIRPESKNKRGCTSAAIVGKGKERDEESLILIDCGPTFYSSALKYFADQGLRKIDAVLLTHAHADAILGLDNLRAWTMGGVIQDHVDVYCSAECFETVRGMFPYLADRSRATGGGGVGDIQFHIIDAQKPFQVPLFDGDSLQVIPLPAHHGRYKGKPFECLGFRIDSMSYLSDCHYIPPTTVQLMAGSQVVVLDALNPYRHASHFSLSQALSFTLSMPLPAPRLSILTDLTHNLEHHQTEQSIQDWRREMLIWKSRLDRAGRGEPSIDQVGQGEGGGARWWDGIWDERQSEQVMRYGLKKSLSHAEELTEDELKPDVHVLDSSSSNSSHKLESSLLPQIHVAWDGMVIHFEREE